MRSATMKIRAVHFAVLDVHVPNIARSLAADRDAAVPVLHRTISHDNVLARNRHPAPIPIAPTLDGDAIVARVELAVFDQHVASTIPDCTRRYSARGSRSSHRAPSRCCTTRD